MAKLKNYYIISENISPSRDHTVMVGSRDPNTALQTFKHAPLTQITKSRQPEITP